MKKTIRILVAAAMATMFLMSVLAGCSSAANQPNNGAPAPDQPQSNGQNGSCNEEKHQPPQGGKEDQGEVLFGKVKSIVGNEVVLEIGKLPSDGGSEDESNADTGQGHQQFYDDGDGPSLVINNNGNVTQIKPGEENNLELEYTGETKTIIIPAGAQIESMLGEGNLDAIKKGFVLQVEFAPDADTDTPSVARVMILG